MLMRETILRRYFDINPVLPPPSLPIQPDSLAQNQPVQEPHAQPPEVVVADLTQNSLQNDGQSPAPYPVREITLGFKAEFSYAVVRAMEKTK